MVVPEKNGKIYVCVDYECLVNMTEIRELEVGWQDLRPQDIIFVHLVLRINGNKKVWSISLAKKKKITIYPDIGIQKFRLQKINGKVKLAF